MLRSADVFMHGVHAGQLREERAADPRGDGTRYVFAYDSSYTGPPISLALPVREEPYVFGTFPAFFDGLLPEGYALDALLRARKLDRSDAMGQLLAVGADLVGAVTVVPAPPRP